MVLQMSDTSTMQPTMKLRWHGKKRKTYLRSFSITKLRFVEEEYIPYIDYFLEQYWVDDAGNGEWRIIEKEIID